MHEPCVIELDRLFGDAAKLTGLSKYVSDAVAQASPGCEVILTGRAPVWLYLTVAHALHGTARRLVYRSPVTGDVTIFDHDPF